MSSKRLTLTLVTTNSQTLAMAALNSKARLPQCFWQLSNKHWILASLSPSKDENCFPLRLTLGWDLRKLAVTVPTGSKIRLFAETGSPATSHHCLGQNQIKATKRSHPRSFLWPRDVLRYLGTKEVLYTKTDNQKHSPGNTYSKNPLLPASKILQQLTPSKTKNTASVNPRIAVSQLANSEHQDQPKNPTHPKGHQTYTSANLFDALV